MKNENESAIRLPRQDINNIVYQLEANAGDAQKLVDEVVNAINEENQTIDTTIREFDLMRYDIMVLSTSVKTILSKVQNVVEFNNEIVKHIEQLTDSSMEVTASTQEAVSISEDNIDKAKETKNVISNKTDVQVIHLVILQIRFQMRIQIRL